ncbi:MAG: L,D-transpeptidase [Lachnospiraceae bacterium]
MNFINNIVKKLFAPLVAIIICFSVITDVSALEADITGNINPAGTDITGILNPAGTAISDLNTANGQTVIPSSDYDDEVFFTEPEQVFEEDKEAEAEDSVKVYPKWQGSRKKPTKDYDYYIKVNKTTCTVTIYIKEENGKLTPYKAMVCSIGREGHETPEGKGYKTSDYYDWRLMVDNTYGRYAVRFNKSIMFHSVPYYKTKKNSLEWQDYNKLGKPASLGCIRLAVADAKWIFDNCKRGTEVEVYSGNASTDPLGTPEPIKLDTKSSFRDWDPTDLTKENPWLVPVE